MGGTVSPVRRDFQARWRLQSKRAAIPISREVLLKTIEMAFILEMDELVYEAFAATPKKQQLSQIEMPTVRLGA